MNVTEHVSGDMNASRGAMLLPCIGFASDALPEVQKPVSAEKLHSGASTKNRLSGTDIFWAVRPNVLELFQVMMEKWFKINNLQIF